MKNKNLPNYLTLLRIVLWVPFLIILAIYYTSVSFQPTVKEYYWMNILAVFIFILAMITDFLDGHLARKYDNVSNFGKLFDPIADKLMTSTALIFLAAIGFTEIWIVVIFIARDIVVDGCRNLAARENKKIAASIWGKLKTLFQSFAIPLIFILGPILRWTDFYWPVFYWILNVPVILALFLSLLSGYFYIKDLNHLIRLKEKNTKNRRKK
ncbi:CDP-diacylglycerol--glycerol-3-phosphate 3-phosphatidyltransferase [Mesomycoplasma lagogenitalium]|uniref:CDP-diacylglycerol--glycerol-3-phosphate 3-phosphatidyltransferase n=1 Tax=Mesomycoplasma lagogenitalium TaxID=171286 RepID=A0ABY8LU98_9BACT|nr:CDP-diacylglycerol--glycerol-3-phosphate 3-phosphatidyltransferase [Mesomycoplasma lagogenitalium]WGI36815.1 CDP-diacylglycerol--glycerol-3-phosphate 3-phosphatidyltransferase [Mesomycoplasma lagogenitalium]